MADQQGGYRRPSSPAPVSGPGALSKRTDGQGARYMSGGEYGEGQEMMDLQTSAPMAKSEQPRMRRGSGQAVTGKDQVTPLFAPTERPEEPVTAGAPFGPGPGPAEMAPVPSEPNRNLEVVTRYLPVLRQVATYEGTPDRFRALVQYLQGSV